MKNKDKARIWELITILHKEYDYSITFEKWELSVFVPDHPMHWHIDLSGDVLSYLKQICLYAEENKNP